MPSVSTLLGCNVFEKFRNRSICILYPHHRGRHFLLWNEILVYQQDGCFASIYVFLIFGICKKTELTRFAVLNLGEGSGLRFRIPIHSPFQDTGQLFGGKFHNQLF